MAEKTPAPIRNQIEIVQPAANHLTTLQRLTRYETENSQFWRSYTEHRSINQIFHGYGTLENVWKLYTQINQRLLREMNAINISPVNDTDNEVKSFRVQSMLSGSGQVVKDTMHGKISRHLLPTPPWGRGLAELQSLATLPQSPQPHNSVPRPPTCSSAPCCLSHTLFWNLI